MKTAIWLAVALAFIAIAALYSPTTRADDKVCTDYFDQIVVRLEEQGLSVIILEAEALAAAVEKFGPATRGFVVTFPDGSVKLGLEQDGCLGPPITLNTPAQPARLSGRVGDMVFA